ncbi:MAG: superoxide dismutase, Fe-Mn family [Patescibacteria group bacterium]|nr:superoxide dismutase, Fe-Mn family [Patescibacteria group bacterium]
MFELPKLKYEYYALEPHIDAKTMEIHHTKHHGGYVEKLNEAILGTEFEGKKLEDILQSENLPTAIRNNGGGHWNHTFFWEILSPKSIDTPEGELLQEINKIFGSFDSFKEEFEKASLGRFGSGWVWLLKTSEGLKISSTPNQDNPLMANAEIKGFPVLGLDVWEHAYYLNYQNKRAEYVKAFWNIVDWDKVSEFFGK